MTPMNANYSKNVDDDGGWGATSFLNPYLNLAQQSGKKVHDDDEDGWEAECGEFIPEPYIDEWGTVTGSNPKYIASQLREKQEKLKEERSDSWGGGVNNADWSPTIQNAQSSDINLCQCPFT